LTVRERLFHIHFRCVVQNAGSRLTAKANWWHCVNSQNGSLVKNQPKIGTIF